MIKSKDGVKFNVGNAGYRRTLYYIDGYEVKPLEALIRKSGSTSYGPSGVPMNVADCYAYEKEAKKALAKSLRYQVRHLKRLQRELLK